MFKKLFEGNNEILVFGMKVFATALTASCIMVFAIEKLI